ncbi:MAG TPA: histidine kinase [Candidatus Binatia bacterium]|nr:histidine kinase [Candidatus Binatia bacterium]
MSSVGRWAVVVAAASALAVGAIHLGYRFAVLSDGATAVHGSGTGAEGGPGLSVVVREPTRSGLRSGDRILLIDGVDPTAVRRSPLDLGELSFLGRPNATVVVARPGSDEPIALRLERGPFPFGRMLEEEWSTILFGAVLLALAGLVFRYRPDDPAARALLVFAATVAGSTPSFVLGLEAQDLVAGPGPLLALGGGVVYASLWAALVRFSVAFADPRRGRRVLDFATAILAAAGILLPLASTVQAVLADEPIIAWVAGLGRIGDALSLIALPLVPAAFVGGYRDHPASSHRLRIRGVALALVGVAGADLGLVYLPLLLTGGPLLPWAFVGMFALPLPLTIAWAILRHAAFDIRLVVSRALVYGGLTLAIVATYALGVALAGAVVRERSGLLPALLASGLVAVLVDPIRRGLQRTANELVYGDRDDPYAAISRLGRRLEASASPEATLEAVTDSVIAALRLPWAALEVEPDREGRPEAEAEPETATPAQTAARRAPPDPGPDPRPDATAGSAGEHFPLIERGVRVGSLVLGPRAVPLDPRERRLLDDLLPRIASAVASVRLAERLQRQRERLVAAREEERRRVRNELHEEIGQAMAGIGLALDGVGDHLADDPESAATILDRVRAEVERSLGAVRRLAARPGLEAIGGGPLESSGRTIGLDPVGEAAAQTRIGEAEAELGRERSAASDAAPPRSAWSPAARATLAAGLLLVVASTLASAARLGAPSDGWGLTTESAGWLGEWRLVFDRPYLPAAAAGLRHGDELVALDGTPARALIEAALSGRPTRVPGEGAEVTYTVRRDRLIDLPIRLAGVGPDALGTSVAGWAVVNPAIVPLFLLGLFVHLRRPESVPARLLYLFGALFLANAVSESIGGVAPRIGDLLDPVLFWTHAWFANLSWVLLSWPIILHLALEFPTRARLLARHPLLVAAALYLAFPLFVIPVVATTTTPLEAWARLIGAAVAWNVGLLAVTTGRLGYLLATAREPTVRDQVRWVAWGLLVTLVVSLVAAVLVAADAIDHEAARWAASLYVMVMPITFAIAIVRHRLFDVDVVLSRTLVYGSLTGLIVGLYGAVVWLGSTLGSLAVGPAEQLVPASLVAAALVAVLAEPLRERLQRATNRLLYGDRDDPYAVLRRLGDRIAAAVNPNHALPAAVEAIAQALKVPYVAVELPPPGEAVLAARGSAPARTVRLPLSFGGEVVGTLAIAPRSPGESFGEPDRRLIADLARQLAVAVHAARARIDLEQASERLALTLAEERRRLRRDLHDGLGPVLTGISLQVEAARRTLERDPAGAARLVAAASRSTRAAIGEIRRIVHDLRPPALDELGLVEAIRHHAQGLTGSGLNGRSGGARSGEGTPPAVRFSVEAPDRLPELPAAVEVAAFRIALEAMTNVLHHARAERCTVRISIDGRLRLEVVDDGRGLPDPVVGGFGLASMRERAAELGGTCRIESVAGHGTRLVAELPLRSDPGSAPAASPSRRRWLTRGAVGSGA